MTRGIHNGDRRVEDMTLPRPCMADLGGDSGRPLRVLVAVHRLDVGGSQLNAIDIASGVKSRGHEIVVAGPPGALVDLIADRGLQYEPIEPHRLGSALHGLRRMVQVTRAVRPDIVHTYEWSPTLLAFLGSHWRDLVPMTVTINSMAVPDFLPGSIPLQVCTPLIAAETRRRSGRVGVLEIPTDCVGQHPDFPDDGFRAELGIDRNELLVVAVSRFARELKQQGLETAIRAAGRLAARHRMRLVLVGDGPAMPELRVLAGETNALAGREIVVLTGARLDPRPAYASADIVVGMGGSLLRAMAFGKPCIVQGESGYWRILDATSAREFRWRGFYGIDDIATGEDVLLRLLDRLLADDALRKTNAGFALDLVRRHYNLEYAVDEQLKWYRQVLDDHTRPSRREIARTMAMAGRWLAKYTVRRALGNAPDDYFNSRETIESAIRMPVPEWFDPDAIQSSYG